MGISSLDLQCTAHVTLPPAGQGATEGTYKVATNVVLICVILDKILASRTETALPFSNERSCISMFHQVLM